MTAKTIPAGVVAQIDAGHARLAWAIEIVRTDGQALRYCSATRDQEIEGETYRARPGLDVSAIACTIGLNVDNGEIVIADNGDVQREDVYDDVWSAARFRLFQFPWNDSSLGVIPWHRGFIADIEPLIAAMKLELRDLRQAAHQDTTRTFQFACPYELGDAKCRKDLTAFTVAGVEVTAVASAQQFTCDLAQAADWATNGLALFTTGDSANAVSRRISLHTGTSGSAVITLERAAIRGITVGDLLTITAGCQHRPNEDCRDKFENKVNYGGCDTKPSASDIVTAEPAE